jgi:MSHA biogenesis protein MshP
MSARMRTPRGFAIIAAIFLLVVLALLGVMIITLSTTQQVAGVQDLMGSRAYFAARAGLEWGSYRVLRVAPASCVASTTLPALAGSAAGFTVQVQCTRYGPYDEAGTVSNVYQIVSTASRGTLGSLDYVERQLQILVTGP